MGAQTALESVREILGRFLEKVLQEMPVDAAYLFGSYAQGYAKEHSDIDVAIVSSAMSGVRFTDNVRLAKLRRSVDPRIEPWGFRPEDFNDDQMIPAEVLKTGIKLFPPDTANSLEEVLSKRTP